MDIDKIIQELSKNEKKVLLTLGKLQGKTSPEEIYSKGDFTQPVEVMNALSWLKSKKLVKIKEHMSTFYTLGKEGVQFVEKGLPERRVLNLLTKNNGRVTLDSLKEVLRNEEIPIAIGWLKRKKWADLKKEDGKTIIEITEKGREASTLETEEEKILRYLKEHPNSPMEHEKIKPLLSRKDVVREKEVFSSEVELTDLGKEVLSHGIEITEEISQITDSIIRNGEWKEKPIRPYDIHAFAPSIYGGKPHPLVELIEKIRRIFLEMGFEEIEGNYVESCFWNMDVLFIPQDHPAREMQDTLYCKTPSEIPIEDEKLLETIARIHENGGNTNSTGWGYKFSKEEGRKALLRTHTTVNTIRYLYYHPTPPAKVFSIGKVFRKENINSTHLPEFYQIEGIIHEENANFQQLIGILKEFYRRMGFEKIRFRPGYFPYTEPSMEVDVYWNNQWMELGGSGIFRPEVTEPVGVKNPVLAWGLGLERLAMLKFGLKDMRTLYTSDFQWLRMQPIL